MTPLAGWRRNRYNGPMVWLTLLSPLPWLAAVAWLCHRNGWWLLSADRSDDVESQASRMRAFGGG